MYMHDIVLRYKVHVQVHVHASFILTIKPAVSNEATGHNRLLSCRIVLRVYGEGSAVAVWVTEVISPQLVGVPGVEVAAMVLVVVVHTIVELPAVVNMQ